MLKTKFVFLTALVVLISIFATAPMQAQDLPPAPVTIHTDLILTWAQVTNRADGSPVKGLRLDDFQLWEDNKMQQIALVKEGQPLAVAILMDGITCLRPPEIEIRRSREALGQLGEDAEFALMAWDSDVRLVQPLTKDSQSIARRLEDRVSFFNLLNQSQIGKHEKVRPERDLPRPGEAIYQATKYLENAAAPNRRKIIIVISSTISTSLMAQTHYHSGDEVEDLLRRSGTTVYALLENNGMHKVDRYDRFNPLSMSRIKREAKMRNGGGTLERFVTLTGGTILTSKTEAWVPRHSLITNKDFGNEFDNLFLKLTGLIRASYTIGYYPENTNFDGTYRRLKIKLSASGKEKATAANIIAREGYHALRASIPAALNTTPMR